MQARVARRAPEDGMSSGGDSSQQEDDEGEESEDDEGEEWEDQEGREMEGAVDQEGYYEDEEYTEVRSTAWSPGSVTNSAAQALLFLLLSLHQQGNTLMMQW